MKQIIVFIAWMFGAACAYAHAVTYGISEGSRVDTADVHQVDQMEYVRVSPEWYGDATEGVVIVDGQQLASVTNESEIAWQPQSLGMHTMMCTIGTNVLTASFNVAALAFEDAPTPNPPMAKNANVSITPLTRKFGVGGGGGAIITSGSGTWTAAVSDPWITLTATSGTVGANPVAYTVDATTNVEKRTGFVYVSGYTHTVTQDGRGGAIDSTGSEWECDGGEGTIHVTAEKKMLWHARPNVNWLSVEPTSGLGEGDVTFAVAPYNEVATRSGTLTVAGITYTVFQYGRRMKLGSYKSVQDYETHVIPITVNALAITTWSVTPNNSWISVVDGGNGKGGDEVTIAIAENPSYKERTGTVTIGTETFTVVQGGTTELSFEVVPAQSTASANGANGLVAVKATPDLPWAAKSQANWVAVYQNFTTGAGNGNIVYSASPNSTIYERTGTILVTPEAASGLLPVTHTVSQPAPVVTLSSNGYTFDASGESTTVSVSVANVVEWEVVNSLSWLTVVGGTSHVGPATVTLQASENGTIYARSGTITIAGKKFTVTQNAHGVEVEYDTVLFDTDGQRKDGGTSSISVHPDGNLSWTAVASDTSWIIIYAGASGKGDGEVQYIVAPYVGAGEARTGTITIGDKVVYITQRPYDLSISPMGETVSGNAGAGEIGVTASVGDVWNAIVTEPSWITIVTGYDSGTGSGTVRFVFTDNDTGKTRSGKIVIAGEAYTLTQNARILVNVNATTDKGGTVEGGGSCSVGSTATLTAHPADGYQFAYWEGDVSSMQNPLQFTVEVAKNVKAVFTPLTPDIISVSNSTEGVALTWKNLAWATSYNIYRAPSSERSAAPLATIVADGTHSYLDVTGTVGQDYWYWVEAVGSDETTECTSPVCGRKQPVIVISNITYTNLRGTTHDNPSTYQEGTVVAFAAPSALTGYTFSGWTPNGITADMKGDRAVQANWTANSYTIAYSSNGGSGEMSGTGAVYDQEVTLSENGFTYSGYEFRGWALTAGGPVDYEAGSVVSNLTAVANGVVTLYAAWEATGGDTPGGGDDPVSYDPPNWVGVTKGDTMVVYAAVQDKKSGERIDKAGSLLAAFDKNGECRGVEEVQEGPFGAFFQLTVGIESISEKGFTLKVWDAATGEITEIATSIDANTDKQIGEFFDLVVYEIGSITQTVALGNGWTWISFALTPDDATVGTLFAGCSFANGDMIKASNKTITYYNGVWYPSTYALTPGKAYMVKKTAGGAEQVEIAGALMSDGLAFATGWNWFGPTTLATQTVSTVAYTGDFANGDQVRSASKTATWYGGKWYASDFKLCSGNGYVAKFANAGTLYFGEAPMLASMSPVAALSAPGLSTTTATAGKPSWKEVTKGDNMVVYVSVHDVSTDTDIVSGGALLAAFDTNGECRGVAEIEDGPFGKVFQLTIGLESTAETEFSIKLWDAATDAIYDVIENVDANADKQIGQIYEPVIYTIKSVTDPLPEIVNPTPEQIETVLAKAEDPKLAENITNESEYVEFRVWAGAVKPHGGSTAAGVDNVMAASNAWVSFALGQDTLLETPPTDEDLSIEAFEPAAMDGKFDFTVSVKDVEVGSEAAAENLKKVFGLEGGSSLQGLSSDNVDIVFGTPENGKVKFTAGPNAANADATTFFMKVKLAP